MPPGCCPAPLDRNPGVVGNQHDEILARIDRLRFDGRLELLLDVRIEVEPGAGLAHGGRLEVGGRECRVRETTLALRLKRAEPLLENAPLK